MANKRPKYRTIAINPSHFEPTQIKFYLVLLPFLVMVVLPILYIVSSAFKPMEDLFAYPPKFIPTRWVDDNFFKLFDASSNTVFPLSLYLFNSVSITVVGILSTLFISSGAAYSLSKLQFRGRQFFFSMNTLSMMFVGGATSIPSYLIVKNLGLLDTFASHIIPALASPVCVFLLKQFIDQVPDSLVEASRIEGANDFQILVRIVFPIIKPALATVFIVLFQSFWNSEGGSTLYINREALKNFAFYMSSLSATGNGVAGVGIAAASALIMFAPNIILFVLMQSRVMNTMAHSGIK